MRLISIVVPAYNEEGRMEAFLGSLIAFCSKIQDFSVEIILVNDGSKDRTYEIGKELEKNNKIFRVVNHPVNKGKGAAVQTGINDAKGDYVIFIDSDGSIDPSQIPPMLASLQKNDIVIGTRNHKDAEVDRPLIRTITTKLFNTYTNLLFRLHLSDLLCGFKGFKTEIARDLFLDLISTRWLFDVEILYKAKKRGYHTAVLPIKWQHKEKGNLNPFTDSIKLAFSILKLWFRIRHVK